ncbi:hypothetical protein [Nesterenkonia ebinurensis]|uniref:hypothetical protein n=1 Tax=Nesterenkonia ebinurensis TaxID=2608252 RepID=UPI00123D5FB3|nr:hypothetical protein [Nesterenkonia ebinurensis]
MTLTTRIAFPLEGDKEVFRTESVIRFQDDGESWQHYAYRQEPGAAEASSVRTEDGFGENTLPSYGEYLLLMDVIGSGAASEQYWRIQDSDPSAKPSQAEVRAAGIENVELPDGPQDCRRYDILEAGARVGSHWATAAGLVRSDWNGPVSFHQSKEVVLGGLDPTISEFLVSGF